MKPFEIRRLGLVAYDQALALQRQLVEERRAEAIPDLLLLVEHPPVLTLGVRGDGGRSHILATPEALAASGIEVFETGRGGDITYHGPGQIVGYPIISLKPDRCDVHRYVRDLEEVLIRVAADYGISAKRVEGLTGVWVGEEKLAAIGVRISRWITSHGFALNVSNYVGTAANVAYGNAMSARVGGKRYIIDTSRNGLGGVAGQWCNVPGQGLGDTPTTSTGQALVDAFLWVKYPGESDGTCNGGPSAGSWWADYALGLAQRQQTVVASR